VLWDRSLVIRAASETVSLFDKLSAMPVVNSGYSRTLPLLLALLARIFFLAVMC
jgi:hypothetical protein